MVDNRWESGVIALFDDLLQRIPDQSTDEPLDGLRRPTKNREYIAFLPHNGDRDRHLHDSF